MDEFYGANIANYGKSKSRLKTGWRPCAADPRR